MDMLSVIFMGSPDFAVPCLNSLANRPNVAINGVFTRKDKPAQRGRRLESTPVKRRAAELGLPIFQLGSLRKASSWDTIRALRPDIIVVAAFGQILPKEILEIPTYGCVNLHASLLPTYRGAAPISAAILQGDPETGVTLMAMDEGLDTGAIITQNHIPIASDDTTETLTGKLAELGAQMLDKHLEDYINGKLPPIPQNSAMAVTTQLIRKEDGCIDWNMPAEYIERMTRAYYPWPGAFTFWNDTLLKIQRASPRQNTQNTEPAGTVILQGKGKNQEIQIICGQNTSLALDIIQLQGKRFMPAGDFIRGYPAFVGSVLRSVKN